MPDERTATTRNLSDSFFYHQKSLGISTPAPEETPTNGRAAYTVLSPVLKALHPQAVHD
jgi:hypothetical protein